ncbi:MAG: site-specific integrase [Lachnospiraceae bacterium]|nr:site-specific integrase [Lachnospiraceae bacterium]
MARKGENIYQRKDGRWEARYIVGHNGNGKAIYRAVYAHSYKAVKEKKQDALRKLAELTYEGQPKAGTVAGISEAWLRDNGHKWKESTCCRYQEKLDTYILPKFGKRELSDISTDEVEGFITMIQSDGMPGRKPVSPSTASMILTVFKQLRLQALKMDCQVRFSAECISVRQRKASISVFSEHDEKVLVSRLKRNTNETDVAILTCLFTGIRIGEVCALNCDNIDLEEGILHIRQTMQRLPDKSGSGRTVVRIDTPKSESSIRDIPLSKELAQILRCFHKPGAFLLTGDRERFVEPRTLENRFLQILKSCGLNQVNFHTTRHTFATRCIERGMDVKTLAEILGHASVATTMDRYVHLSMKHKADGIGLLSDLFTV